MTFNHFLEEAAEKEVRGKARLQHFIENLLQRVDVAERQLEYYQNQQVVCSHSHVSEHLVRLLWRQRAALWAGVGSLAHVHHCCSQMCIWEMSLQLCFINCHFTRGKGAESLKAAIAKDGEGRVESI